MKLPALLIVRLIQAFIDRVAALLPAPWDQRLKRWSPWVVWFVAWITSADGEGRPEDDDVEGVDVGDSVEDAELTEAEVNRAPEHLSTSAPQHSAGKARNLK